MAKMLIKAMKLTENPESIKVVYEKDGTLYMRSGADGFETGTRLQVPLLSLINKQGFMEVSNPPEIRDSEELLDNLTRFEAKNDDTIEYR